MKRKLLALTLALALGLSLLLTACGGDEKTVLKVGASPTPHAQILEQVKAVLAEQDIDLQIVEYTDYVIPNTAVEEGENDANYFQHNAYLEDFNTKNGTHLISVASIHYEPFGVYVGKAEGLTSLADLPDGATISIPNDGSNEARALYLMEAEGLITLDHERLFAETTPLDIVDNPKNLVFREMEAAMLPSSLSDVDCAIINGNYALGAGLSITDAIAAEAAESEAGTTYANIIVIKEGNEDNEAVAALVAALQSDAIRDYINETFTGAVVPLF
ncbi:MAG: ABC transporter substrate-binding protein [Clostridiales bacterium]|nr:ABC transporter substrate-binding protein [Clostridiales bacterium]